MSIFLRDGPQATPPRLTKATVQARAYALWEQDQSRSSHENWHLAEEQLTAEYETEAYRHWYHEAEESHRAYLELLDEDELDEALKMGRGGGGDISVLRLGIHFRCLEAIRQSRTFFHWCKSL